MMNQSDKTFKDQVYSWVSLIPSGRVLSYGDIASLAHKPKAARIVGQIAKRGPTDLPSHRVVKSDGTLASGFAWGGAQEQQRMLEAEGLEFKTDKHQIKHFNVHKWRPDTMLKTATE